MGKAIVYQLIRCLGQGQGLWTNQMSRLHYFHLQEENVHIFKNTKIREYKMKFYEN